MDDSFLCTANAQTKRGVRLPGGSVLSNQIVGIAVQPSLTRLPRGYHRMRARLGVPRGVARGGVVAAARAAALLAGPKVGPAVAGLHAVFALVDLGGLDLLDRRQVHAAFWSH